MLMCESGSREADQDGFMFGYSSGREKIVFILDSSFRINGGSRSVTASLSLFTPAPSV